MPAPWEKYGGPVLQKPWERYGVSQTPLEEPATAIPEVAASTAPPQAPPSPVLDALGAVDSFAAQGVRGLVKGASTLAGLPVDALNAIFGATGLPSSERPLLGSQMIEDIIMSPTSAIRTAQGLEPDVAKPSGPGQRIIRRVGEELGATGLPVAGALATGARIGKEGVRRLGPVAKYFLEPATVAPANLLKREVQFATGAGLGAGTANEIAGENAGIVSDLVGSLGGVGLTAAGSKIAGAGRNALGAATGRPQVMDDIAGQEVADRIINNSTTLADQFNQTGQVDTTPLARQLRTPADVEDIVPGFTANIGDRSQDPLLMTLVQNQDTLAPGAANTRRAANDDAISSAVAAASPEGDSALFRAALEGNRDAQIAAAARNAETKSAAFETAVTEVQPGLTDATARGTSIRAGLQDAFDTTKQQVNELFQPINESTATVPAQGLRDRFSQTAQDLPVNDQQRFLPAEATVPERLPDEVPLSEVASIRSGLTDDIRAQRAAGQNQAARVGSQFRGQTDEFLDQNLPTELRDRYDAARAARRDQADRFERPGTAIADTLRTREGGGPALDASAVPGRFAQPDSGRVTDTRSLLAEAGQDPRVRDALADEVLADVQSKGLVDKPGQLTKYIGDRDILLDEFPELRDKLTQAGAAKSALDDATREAAETTKRLTTPGRSAQASFLKFDQEATVDAVRNLVNNPKPREAARELLEAAGNSPEARSNARAALWEAVKTKTFRAPGTTGATRFDVKQIRKFFDDPKTSAVAEELWSDAPEELASIKELFGSLAKSEGSVRARAAGSSGTAQALNGKFDPALSVSSVASRGRSVSRGQLSPTIAVVDVLSTWLRRRSAQVQSRAIDTLASAAFNEPGLAADLLEKYNPADFAARRRLITQKYGVRGTQVMNLIGQANESDETVEAAK